MRLSLRTRCPDRAGDLARYLAACGKLIKGDPRLAKLRQDQIREMVRGFFQASLDSYLTKLDATGFSSNALEDMRHEMELHEDFLTFDTKHPQYLPIAKFREAANVSDQNWAENEFVLVNEMRKARRDVLRSVLSANSDRQQYFRQEPHHSLETLHSANSGNLGDAVSDFFAEHSPQWSEEMVQKMQGYLAIMIEHFGANAAIAKITRQDASELKKVLLAMPSNRKTKPQTRDLTLREAIAVPNIPKIGVKTVNNHIDAYRRFFEWAERNGYVLKKLFDGMKIAIGKHDQADKMPFSKDDARLIFTTLAEERWNTNLKSHQKWGPLIALFTGARLNEIAQLDVSDIRCESGVWLFDFNPDGEKKRLKSRAGTRKVPVHKTLIEIGFLDYVSGQDSKQRLFPDLSYNKQDGYGRNLGRWFNGSFLLKLGLKRPDVTFHCFRHTMITRLNQSSVSPPLIQEIVGHEKEGVTQRVYAKEGFTLEQKNEALAKFSL